MRLSSKARAVAIVVALLFTVSLPLLQHEVVVYASQPSLTDIFSSLGFNNVTELTIETFPAGAYNITLYAKFGGDNQDLQDVNELSFYPVNKTINYTDPANTINYTVLFTPQEPAVFGYVLPPLSKIFWSGSEFGLSLLSWWDTRYFTEHVQNPDYALYPEYSYHAKIYLNLNDPTMFLIGFDERSFCNQLGNLDFNDMVFSLQMQYYLDVVSAFDTPTGQGWYTPGTYAFASLASDSVDTGNGTRGFFRSWSGDASGNNTLSDPIYMDQNRTAVAVWHTQHYLTVRTSPADLVTIPGEDWYDEGTAKALTAPVVAGYAFVYWDIDGAIQDSGTNPITVTVDRPHTATAHYLNIYTLKVEVGPGGSTDPPVGTYTANEGSTVQVTANPSASYAFDHWLLDETSVGSVNPYSVLMDRNHTLRALFKTLPPPSVTINPMSATIWVGESVSFSSTVSGQTPPYTYQWYLNNNPVPGATSNSWTFISSEAGGYSVYLKVTDVNGNTAQSGTAQVTVRLPLSVSISPLDSSILPGQTVTFISTVAGGTPPYSYQWYLGGNPVVGATSSSWKFQPMKSGTFYVYVEVTDVESNKAQSGISRVEVRSIPVGGYVVSFEKQADRRLLTLSFAFTIVLATFLVAVKRKTKRTKP